MTPALRQFLTDRLAWAEAGAPEHEHFSPHYGLCHAAYYSGGKPLQWRVQEALGHCGYPFGGSVRFELDCNAGTQHKNPARLAWVKQQLGLSGG